MRWLLFYKGTYSDRLAGPEIRYLRFGEELVRQGDSVVVMGRSSTSQVVEDCRIRYVSCQNLTALFREFFNADVVVLHGGGPIVLFVSLLAGLSARTRLVLDAYAPHWLELHQSYISGRGLGPLKTFTKVSFNLFRFVFGAMIFDSVVVANKRQLDIARGVLCSAGRISSMMGRVHVVPFGCDKPVENKNKQALIQHADARIAESDLVVGWLGGVWDWFNLDPVLVAYAQISNQLPTAKFVFFGIPKGRFEVLQKTFSENGGRDEAIMNLEWVPYDQRLKVWMGIDLAVVWGESGLENDYASRTRNFDCISAGIPVIQNWDDQWGPIILDNSCGTITTLDELQQVLHSELLDTEGLRSKSQKMMSLYPNYSWETFTRHFKNVLTPAKLSIPKRLYMLVSGLLLWFGLLLVYGFDFMTLRVENKPNHQ